MNDPQTDLTQTQRLIRTKLYVPRVHPDLVDRPRLIQKLNDGLLARLVLVTAPAGYGKTTLLAKWVEQARMPVAWLSLDSRDNDPTSFWAYFIAALQNSASQASAVAVWACCSRRYSLRKRRSWGHYSMRSR